MEEYNKELCEERQVRRDSQVGKLETRVDGHDTQLTELSKAVLTLTALAKNEQMWKWVVLALTAVIATLAFGKEVAATLVTAALP